MAAPTPPQVQVGVAPEANAAQDLDVLLGAAERGSA
jgi:hypothetical protein